MAIFILTIAGISTVFAQEAFPTINVLCENKSGILRSFDDGFSLLKKCPNGGRKVIIAGMQGEKGDKGDQGEPGPQGSKGESGDSGFIADKIIDVCFHVDTAALTVMKGGTCSPHVHWRIPVQCVTGKPCQPDNPDDPFYDPLQ